MGKRAIIYGRVSYDDRDTDGRNLASQLEMGREYCRKNDYTIVEELAEDSRGASGVEINLPQLNKALEMARAGLYDVLVIRELDRFSRDVGKLYIVEQELKRSKVVIKYVLYDFPDNPAGQLMKNIYASFAQFEREEIRLRMMRGKRNKVNDGNILVSTGAPYGYRVKQTDKLVLLEKLKSEANIIKQIYTWYARDFLPIREIVRRLDSMAAPIPESGGRKRAKGWPRSTIFRILRNKTYTGEWSYTYSETEHLTVKVPQIIDLDLWEAAQAILDNNKAITARAPKYEYLMAHRLTCSSCGRFMGCEPQTTRGKVYLYYVCPGPESNRRGGCSGYRINAEAIDTLVWDWLSSILKDPEKLKQELDLYQSGAALQYGPALEQLKITDDLLIDNRNLLGRLIDLYMSGTYSLEIVQERKKRLEDAIKSLEDQRANLAGAIEGQVLTTEQIDDLQAFASELCDRLEGAVFEEKVKLFHALNVTGILSVIDGKKILHIQCILHQTPDMFIYDDKPTIRFGRGTAILPRFHGWCR
ncbi:MAG: recombinase family protein [Anaerolineaceae bacterium]|nr:recombinase family protein [Anaerolineaceae bacterium]